MTDTISHDYSLATDIRNKKISTWGFEVSSHTCGLNTTKTYKQCVDVFNRIFVNLCVIEYIKKMCYM